MKNETYFDNALPVFASVIEQRWGAGALESNVFLRDVTGRLSFVVLDEKYNLDDRRKLGEEVFGLLGNYVDDAEFAVTTPEELFDDSLKSLESSRKAKISWGSFKGEIHIVDRRMVGADWLRVPAVESSPPKRISFASIKGGVGRSTALCVVAAHLASKGRRVLAIDMDIEAPGLGNMLLPADTLPPFGLLDYLVERNLGELDDEFYVDMVGASWLGGGRGRVDVIPAIGQRSLENPENVLAKIARAYLPGQVNGTSESSSFLDHINVLVGRFADPHRYDVILIDSRAGLHETTAAAVVGLGAEVLFFGIDQPQTFAGYELLLAHLGTLPVLEEDDWRDRLYFVQAKAPVEAPRRNQFAITMAGLFAKYLWPVSTETIEPLDVSVLSDTFELEWEDEAVVEEPLSDSVAEPLVLAVLDDDRYHSFDPLTDRDTLAQSLYEKTFGEIIKRVEQVMEIERSRNDGGN